MDEVWRRTLIVSKLGLVRDVDGKLTEAYGCPTVVC
jgi:hypothetical protein